MRGAKSTTRPRPVGTSATSIVICIGAKTGQIGVPVPARAGTHGRDPNQTAF